MPTTIVDVEGVRIDDVAIDYFTPKISFWDGEKWLEQELSRDDLKTLCSAMSYILYGIQTISRDIIEELENE